MIYLLLVQYMLIIIHLSLAYFNKDDMIIIFIGVHNSVVVTMKSLLYYQPLTDPKIQVQGLLHQYIYE